MARKHSEGKLTQSDEGELEFKITPYKGRVIMDWGKLVHAIHTTDQRRIIDWRLRHLATHFLRTNQPPRIKPLA